jgi:hypothetical protein
MRQREITDTLPLGILDRREDGSQRDEVEADDGFSLSASPSKPGGTLRHVPPHAHHSLTSRQSDEIAL